MNFGKICLICVIFVNNWRQCCVVISTDKRVLLQTCHSLALFSCLYICFWKQIFSSPATVASSVQKVTAMELAPARSPTLDPGRIANNNNTSSKVSCYCGILSPILEDNIFDWQRARGDKSQLSFLAAQKIVLAPLGHKLDTRVKGVVPLDDFTTYNYSDPSGQSCQPKPNHS